MIPDNSQVAASNSVSSVSHSLAPAVGSQMEKKAAIPPPDHSTDYNGTDKPRASSENRSDSLAGDDSNSGRVLSFSSSRASVAQPPAASSINQSAAVSPSLADDEYLLQTPISFSGKRNPQQLDRFHYCTDFPRDRDDATGMSLGDQVFYPDDGSDKIYFGVVRWIGYLHMCTQVEDNILLAGIELVFVVLYYVIVRPRCLF